MEVGFDKEIDAILRRARGDEVVTSTGAHLDADEISAFAENALPEKIRQNYIAHFADCTRCRKFLSNVILLNSEAETETASSAVSAEIKEAKTPWYRKLFVFPQLAYAMGALVLLFSGFFGYLILQNLSGSKNSEVSYSTDKSARMQEEKPASPANTGAPGFSTANTASNATTTTTNSTVATTTTGNTNSASTFSTSPANTTNSIVQTERKSDADQLNAPVLNQPAPSVQATPAVDDNKVAVEKDLAKTPPKNEAAKPNAAGAVREETRPRDKENPFILDGQESTTEPKTEQQRMKSQRAAPESPKKKVSEAGTTRSAGGKTFNNVGGIWFDAALGKQKQKTVTRGTKDYLKLDAGLRSIADSLGGTVVILWNGKGYRIQ